MPKDCYREGDERADEQRFCEGVPEVGPIDTGWIRGETGADEGADEGMGGGDGEAEYGCKASGECGARGD